MKFSTSVVKAFTLLFIVVLFSGFISSASETTQDDTTITTTQQFDTTTTTELSTTTTTQPDTTTTTQLSTTTRPGTTATTQPGKTTTTRRNTTTTNPGTTAQSDPTKPSESILYSEFVLDAYGSKVFDTDEFGSTVYVTTIVYETQVNTDLQDEMDENGNVVYNSDIEQKDFATKKIVWIVLIVAITIGAAAFALSFLGKKK